MGRQCIQQIPGDVQIFFCCRNRLPCQQDGIIQTPGDLQRLVEFGVELTFYTVSQWCSSGGSFPLRPRVYEKMEDFYVIAPEYRGLWKKEPGTPEEDA